MEERTRIINYIGKTTSQRRWTNLSLECLKRGCNCQNCFYQNFFSDKNQRCQMKSAVLELVRVQGMPKNMETKGVIEE